MWYTKFRFCARSLARWLEWHATSLSEGIVLSLRVILFSIPCLQKNKEVHPLPSMCFGLIGRLKRCSNARVLCCTTVACTPLRASSTRQVKKKTSHPGSQQVRRGHLAGEASVPSSSISPRLLLRVRQHDCRRRHHHRHHHHCHRH